MLKKFSCDTCHKRFSRLDHLKSHLKTHSYLKPYQCDVCGNRFTQIKSLQRHKLCIHVQHRRRHECEYCHKLFSQSGSLRMHIRIHTGYKPYSCHLCNETFRRNDMRKYHIANKHSGEKFHKNLSHSSNILQPSFNKNDTNVSERKQFQCNVCLKKFNLVFNLKNHRKKHSRFYPFSCEHCGYMFSQTQFLLQHQATEHAQKSFSCHFCGRDFDDKNLLQSHLESVEEKYDCEFCDIVCVCVVDLLKHLRLHHAGDKPYTCSECTVTFSESGQLQDHLLTHRDKQVNQLEKLVAEKKLLISQSSSDNHVTCRICGMIFESLAGYYGHKKTHNKQHFTGKKENNQPGFVQGSLQPQSAYVCMLCGKKFKTVTALRGHAGGAHAKKKNIKTSLFTSGMRHKCKICGTGFNSAATLYGHYKTHQSNVKQENVSFKTEDDTNPEASIKDGKQRGNNEVYTCNVCGKNFNSSSTLGGHKRIHPNPLMKLSHKCHVCGKTFSQKTYLNRHILVHSGEKRYKCKLCGLVYNRPDNLQSHIKLKHNKGG